MHIHLPKLVRNWREFLSEVGIIVVGILIALGLEQVIEFAHWRHKADQAIEDLRGAMVEPARQAEEQRVTGLCIDRQRQLLAARLTAPGPYRPTPLLSERQYLAYTVRAPSRLWDDTVWQAATGGAFPRICLRSCGRRSTLSISAWTRCGTGPSRHKSSSGH